MTCLDDLEELTRSFALQAKELGCDGFVMALHVPCNESSYGDGQVELTFTRVRGQDELVSKLARLCSRSPGQTVHVQDDG